ITKNGELYNVDGNGNRVAALCYGPKKVILVVGCNKIVDDLPAAVKRVKTVAAPLNARRLHCQTPCAETGHCLCPDSLSSMDGCASPGRICGMGVVTGRQRNKGRIHVILVGESLGY
ncbi:MAG: LUD domain-containing protein, partial [Clostridia bacterium]|nr:LUD domain-containing protein [Clostridia bacterium]